MIRSQTALPTSQNCAFFGKVGGAPRPWTTYDATYQTFVNEIMQTPEAEQLDALDNCTDALHQGKLRR